MILEHFLLSLNETNCYVIACSDTNKAAIIDPGEWNDQIAEFLAQQELELSAILITHDHQDHTGGIAAISSLMDVQIAGHPQGTHQSVSLSDGDKFELGNLKIKVLETPGHTADSLTFVVGCDVFCGDLIFAGSIGGVPDKESFEQEVQSVREKIFPLGDDMVLHPGHGPATTVLIERTFNPLLIP